MAGAAKISRVNRMPATRTRASAGIREVIRRNDRRVGRVGSSRHDRAAAVRAYRANRDGHAVLAFQRAEFALDRNWLA